MIKKILITLLVLIIIITVGIISLVMFVDPNNFRGFISETVKDKTGYTLSINGDLRWHVWPQISILTESIRLEDEGAEKPILIADNMRLDVELFPLFSKELAVKNVLVKSASINITDQSKGAVAKGENKQTTTINQSEPTKTTSSSGNNASWSFSLNRLEIADSTVVIQNNNDIVSFRDINIQITQQDEKNVVVDISGDINRDQQDFNYTINANINLATFPDSAVLVLNKFTFNYQGVDVPAGRLKGELSATINYQKSPLMVNTDNLLLTVNDNTLKGSLKAELENKPYFEAVLHSNKVDLTAFTNTQNGQNSDSDSSAQAQQTAPVVSSKTSSNELAFLNEFDGRFYLTIDELWLNKLTAKNFVVDATNQSGIATLNKIDLDLADGHISANGRANGAQKTALVQLVTEIKSINLDSLLTQLEVANDMKGQFNANGNISTNTLNSSALIMALQGDLDVVLTDVRFENINVQNIIQSAVAQYSKDVATPENQQKFTSLHELSTKANIKNGNVDLTSIKASSETLNVAGNGRVGLVNKDIDVDLNVQILGGWNGKSETISQLQKVVIPLRIYGQLPELHYQLEVDKVIKSLINDKLNQSLDKLKDRLQSNRSTTDDSSSNEESDSSSSSSDKEKVTEALGSLLNKLKK